ncbi:MAG: zinc transporter ZntB, partial [Xanthomonadales bacterium]|nr:zinc transporter ZntB [Xanthomonadales bacterium]NIX13226.1 zinc transporter ZntB [Xanthomonadales bacterium]
QELLWVDMDFSHPDARAWLDAMEQIPLTARRAMLAPESRPNIMQFSGGILIILRGVNLNEGAQAEDMISVRIWIDKGEIITCRQRNLQSIQSIAERLGRKTGPRTTGELLSDLAGELADRVRGVVSGMEDELDALESGEGATGGRGEETYSRIRRRAAVLRRHLNPQREALQRLQEYQGDLLGTEDLSDLVVHTNTIIHSIEDLEVLREHTQALQDELFSQMSRDQNDRIYMLTIVAAIFLPLTFISGLLGMNVGGIPGADSPLGFWAIILLCLAIVLVAWLFFRRRRWL